jgi:hypothetical protein
MAHHIFLLEKLAYGKDEIQHHWSTACVYTGIHQNENCN